MDKASMDLRTEVFMGRASTKLVNGSICNSRLLRQTCSFGVKGFSVKNYNSIAMTSSEDNINSVAAKVFMESASSNKTGLNGGARFWISYEEDCILDACEDEYGGMIVNPETLPWNTNVFAHALEASISSWKQKGKKGIWLKVPLGRSELVPIAVKILVVQEKYCSSTSVGGWKLPTGFIHESEEIFSGVVREVKEETGIDTEFLEVVAFRHAHHLAFGKSDLFFICMLRPISNEIKIDEQEIKAAKWMPLDEFTKQPFIQDDKMFKKIIDICMARLGKRHCGLLAHQVISKFDGRSSSLYYTVEEPQKFECEGL
ncbi:nudix hydrolase 8-like isoform X2 [Zingiber officinale]|uniref:nudix hydrolase 8-like isoform X2 n=1 Tax=Zingiber officinale TaxID=94328 RepID=UPI001C4AF5F4|nr:nudix hydrolase 8-like isoform X2 [Zingiber officinale]